MSQVRRRVVVTDASVLINFAWIGRFDLFGALEEYDFWVPAGVVREVLRPAHAEALVAAFARRDMRQVDLVQEELEHARGIQRRQRLGLGESLCLALAERHVAWIACDEKGPRFRNAVQAVLGPGRVLSTSGVVVVALRQASLTLAEADAFIEVWRQNRYLVDFQSFRELMEQDSGGDRVAEEVVALRRPAERGMRATSPIRAIDYKNRSMIKKIEHRPQTTGSLQCPPKTSTPDSDKPARPSA